METSRLPISMPSSSAFVETTPRILPFPQAALDLPPFIRKIAASISNNDFVGHRPLLEGILQIPHEDFCDQPAVGENDRGNIALQKCRSNVLRFLHVRSTNAELTVDDRRIVEEDMLLTLARATLANEFERLARSVSPRAPEDSQSSPMCR